VHKKPAESQFSSEHKTKTVINRTRCSSTEKHRSVCLCQKWDWAIYDHRCTHTHSQSWTAWKHDDA